MKTFVKPFIGYGDKLNVCRGLTLLPLSQKDGKRASTSIRQPRGKLHADGLKSRIYQANSISRVLHRFRLLTCQPNSNFGVSQYK
jgi:hypothetical protein